MIDFRCYGFVTMPVGLIDAISASVIDKNSTVYIMEPIGLPDPPYTELEAADKTNLWIVIYTHEPATYAWFDRLLENLQQRCKILKNRIVLHTSCLADPECPIPMVSSIVDYATDIVSQLGRKLVPRPVSHHFVCLNRLHKWQRWELVNGLIQQGFDRFGKISYLQSASPMVLDTSNVSWMAQRNIDHPSISGAAINIITETSYEPKSPKIKPSDHYRPCITEKTFKSMYLCQFPIWVSPCGTVNCIRDLGFDTFDDIIDHEYDQEPDPKIRLHKILAEIERLLKIDLCDWQASRNENLSRFQANLDNLIRFYGNHRSAIGRWNEIFSFDQKSHDQI